MTIDDTIAMLRAAMVGAQRSGDPVYVLAKEGGYRISAHAFADDVQIRVWPDGSMDAVCDGCGRNLAPIERSDEMGELLRKEKQPT